MQTLSDIRTQVSQLLDEEGITATETRINSAINQAHQMRLSGRKWPFMRWPSVETFALVSGQKVYPLHSQVGMLDSIKHVASDTPIRETAASDIQQDDVGDKFHFTWVGDSPVKMGDTIGEVLNLVSTSGTDTGVALAITVEGTDATGEMVTDTVTPTGTTNAPFAVTFVQIVRITKPTGWTGTMKILRANGTTVIMTLGPTEYGRKYKRIQLLADPAETGTVAYQFYRLPRWLSADKDVTDLPEPFEQILVYDAVLLMAAYNENIGGNAVKIWMAMQGEWEKRFHSAYLHGRVTGSQAGRIRDADIGGC